MLLQTRVATTAALLLLLDASLPADILTIFFQDPFWKNYHFLELSAVNISSILTSISNNGELQASSWSVASLTKVLRMLTCTFVC